MEIIFTKRARKDFADLSPQLKAHVRKQLALLQQNLRHPSLDAKKYRGTDDIWQGRVNRDYRFYFRIIDDTCHVLMIIPHPK